MIELRLALARVDFSLDVALALPARGVSALFGASGCGKTTLLRALAGLERAAGRVQVGDEVWQDDSRRIFVPTHRRPLGYVIQEAALFPHLDVRRNLDYGRSRVAPGQRRVSLDDVVGLLGIAPLMARSPATLSGGERQRVAIARALATSPRVLLMDEPLAALDAARKADLLPYLERLHEALDIPVIYVSHALDEVARLADHLVLMDAGRVRAAGPIAELLARLDLPLAIGEDAGVVLDGVVGERDARWQLARLDVPQPGAPCCLWARDPGIPIGRPVRLRVLARDVSLARTPQVGTSIGNQLPATVEAVADAEHPALALVRVRIGSPIGNSALHDAGKPAGGVALVARLTRRSAHALELAPGVAVWAQVKTVALMEQAAQRASDG